MVTHDPTLTERTSRTVIISDGEIVDGTVAHALPLLTHHQMLNVTHYIQRQVYPPCAAILQKEQHVDTFFMIASGQVEVVLQNRSNMEMIVARLGPGEFFGEVELMNGSKSIASIRVAPEGPAELVMLRRDEFHELLSKSPLTEQSIGQIVQARIEENRAHDRRNR